MPSGNKSRKGKRERGRDGHGGTPNHGKTAQPSGDKRTPTTTENEPTSRLAANESLKTCTSNNVHHMNADEEMAAAICWICAEPIKYYSLPSCNHRTCHVCALRLRVLYEKVECTFCKELQSSVIFTTSPDADFSSYNLNAIPHKYAQHSIFFETKSMMEETLKLLRFNCPSVECDYTGSGWDDLKLHARAMHERVFCDLCIRFKKVFPHEYALYPPNVLPLHLPSMPNLSRPPQSEETIEGGTHPLCAFCSECFFGDDEMFVHMREQHEECFLCKRNDIRYRYFQNYDSLEQHFSLAHFACVDSGCQAQKFVVFDSELDLNAHRLEAHGGDMSQKERKKARRVQLDSREARPDFSWQAVQGSTDWQRLRESAPQIVQTQGSAFGVSRATAEGMSEDARETQRPAQSGRAAPANASIFESLASKSSAHNLVTTISNVLDQNLQDTAKIINAIINFLGEEDKKHNLLAAWSEYETESQQIYRNCQPYDLDPPGSTSHYADIMSVWVPGTVDAFRYTQQLPRADLLDHHATQPGGPSSPSSPPDPINSVFTPAFSDPLQSEVFPSLVRPRAKSTAALQLPQSNEVKSWASVAALSHSSWASPAVLSHSPSSPTTSKQAGAPRQPPVLSVIDDHPSLPSRVPFVSGVTSADWASIASPDLAAWTPSWNAEGGGSAIPETPASGQGKKGKGKQRQRFASASFSF